MNNVVVPIRLKNRFKKGDVELPKGVLLYGPPGNDCSGSFLFDLIKLTFKINKLLI